MRYVLVSCMYMLPRSLAPEAVHTWVYLPAAPRYFDYAVNAVDLCRQRSKISAVVSSSERGAKLVSSLAFLQLNAHTSIQSR